MLGEEGKMSYLRMYRDDYVKENELEHLYLNHTEKFVTYMEEQGLGDRIFDIGPDQLRQSVAEYSKRGSIKTINTMNNHLNAIRNFFVYLHKKGKADNIFNRIADYDSFKKQIAEENQLRASKSKGYFDSDQIGELLDYFNSGIPSKYANMTMMNFYFKINLLVPAKKKVIANLLVSDFSDEFDKVKINGVCIKLPRALSNDIKNAIAKLNREIDKQELFFALFFQSHSYAETVFNTPFYYALKETGYELGKRKKPSFPVEHIRNTGIVNMYNNGTELDIISKIAGITLLSLEKLLKDLNIEFEDKWDEKVNREICRVDYYQQI